MKKFVFVLLAFSLSLSAQESVLDSLEVQNLEEVIVSSVRVKDNIPIAFNNVSKEEISKRNLGQDIPILLNFLPNVVTTSDAGAGIGYTGIRIRGVNSQSTNVTINGIPYNDAESLGTFWVDLPDFSSSVENLQVQRGIGTSVNGSSAFGASINILTDKISQNPYFESANTIGSFNTVKNNFRFSTGLLNETIEFSGRLSKIDSDGYIDRASSDLKSYFLQLSYKKNKTLLKFLNFGGHEITYQAWNGIDLQTLENNRTYNPSGLYYDLNGEERFHENEVDNYKQDHFQFHWTQSFSENLSSNLGLNLTNGRGYYEQYNENGSEDFITRKWLDNQFYVINYTLNYLKNNNNIIFGSTYSEYDGDHFGETIWSQNSGDIEFTDLFYNGNGLKKDFSNFIKSIYQISNDISIYADLQLRNIDYQTFGSTSNIDQLVVDKKYSFFNPKAGLNYDINQKNKIYFSLSKAHREPTRSDFENNINIQPEELIDYELGWKYNSEKFFFNSNLYYMGYKNQLVLTGALDDVGSPIRENSGKSYRMGIELESVYKATNKLNISANISLSENKNVDYKTNYNGVITDWGDTDISFSPNVISSAGIQFIASQDLTLTLLNKFVGNQYMSNTESNISKLSSYSTTDLNILYTIKNSAYFSEIIVTAMINNIFNKEYVSNGYYYTYDDTWSDPNLITTIEGTVYYPQAKRNFLLGLTFKL
ncbi:MAG: TonB-dependent receptor [Flavobacteriales bacterium]|nr:MAG: TonB-dependent receptor [Flavobacteriales bacterium]